MARLHLPLLILRGISALVLIGTLMYGICQTRILKRELPTSPCQKLRTILLEPVAIKIGSVLSFVRCIQSVQARCWYASNYD